MAIWIMIGTTTFAAALSLSKGLMIKRIITSASEQWSGVCCHALAASGKEEKRDPALLSGSPPTPDGRR